MKNDIEIILDIENVEIVGKNKKLIPAKNRKFPIKTDEYKLFEKTIFYSMRDVKLKGPLFGWKMIIECYHDIDAVELCVQDIMQKKKIFPNDRDVVMKQTYKIPIKKGSLGKIKIYAWSINHDTIKNIIY